VFHTEYFCPEKAAIIPPSFTNFSLFSVNTVAALGLSDAEGL